MACRSGSITPCRTQGIFAVVDKPLRIDEPTSLAERAVPMPSSALTVSIVVPVYNSATILPELVARLEPVLRASTAEFEAVFVNDASRDASWQVLRQLKQRHKWVRAIDLMRNSGQHNALLCGIRAARFNIVVTLDDDLQNPPEEIPHLLAALSDTVDVVYGAPQQEVHGLLRNVASQVTKIALQGALGAQTARMVGPFRAFRTDIRRAFEHYDGIFVNIDVLLTWGTMRFKAIRVHHHERRAGVSNYTFRKLLTHSLNMLTGFTTAPLQLASVLGFSATLLGLVLFAFVVGRYFLQASSVPGFAFLASVIIVFSGAQLLTLGIIGEYLARMHSRLLHQPPYVVRESDDD